MIIERVVTVEYLDPTMKEALLLKFPDNSAFDFDYSQSGIWSPLVARGGQSLVSTSSVEIRRKLSDGFEQIAQEKIKKVSSTIKEKITSATKKGNSAFDFDYSQSGIWSPLVPRGQSLVSSSSVEIRRKLSDGFEKIAQEKIKKMSSKIKKKVTSAMSKGCSDFSNTHFKGSSPRKGWARVLKVTSKRFKKQKDSSAEIKLSNYLNK